jgi:hypothetical protein
VNARAHSRGRSVSWIVTIQLLFLVAIGLLREFTVPMFVVSAFGLIAFALLLLPTPPPKPTPQDALSVPALVQRRTMWILFWGPPPVLTAVMVVNSAISKSIWLGVLAAVVILVAEYVLLVRYIFRNGHGLTSGSS